jgi:dipeptidase
MCDTLVALGNSTADGSVMLAKNSDREPNEAQALVYLPAAIYPSGATVKCTFAEIPQVRETHAVILSKPFWMYGCEMGANEAGVAIGNEAVFSKEPYETTGLSGMDVMRLALERAASAEAALRTILDLLGRHGQCALGGYRHTMKYHNSFLIADRREAYVLETAGRYWAVEQVRDVRAISNGLSIQGVGDDAAPGLVEHAIQRGWARSRAAFDFARCYREPLYTTLSASGPRRACTTAALHAARGHITLPMLAAALRDHGPQAARPGWTPGQGLFMQVCAHAAPGPIRGGSQTAGSMIAHLGGVRDTFWLTGSAAPCTGLFKPAWFAFGAALAQAFGPLPGAMADEASRWWRHERLHRAVLQDYATRQPLYQAERNALEEAFMAEAATADPTAVTAFYARADAAETSWTARAEHAPVQHRAGWLYRRFWAGQDAAAKRY